MRKHIKAYRKVEDALAVFVAAVLTIAFTFTSVGVAIWSVKWVLRLLGVM